MSSPSTAAYRDLLHQLDEWFAQSSARHPGVVPCRSGCSQCCYGPFDISVADVMLIRDALEQLPEGEQRAVKTRAHAQVEKMRKQEPDWNVRMGVAGLPEEAFDRLSEAMADEPCPFLDESGACRIYSDRPLVCRMMGLGMVTPAGRIIENACPIADQFPDYSALPPQPFDLEALEELEIACLEAASFELFGTPSRSSYETTIALAVSDG